MDGLLQNAPQLLVVAGMAVLCYFLMRRNSSRNSEQLREKSGQPIRSLLPDKSRDRALQGAPPELVRWQVEMHETARDLKAEIDSKLLALQSLINIAREERAQLEAAIERATAAKEGSPRRSDSTKNE